MSQEYILHRDGLGRFLLQDPNTGMLEGMLFPAMAGESARAFSYDYGSVWYPNQIINLSDFPELAEMPFFTVDSCSFYNLDSYFQKSECQTILPLLGTFAKFAGYGHSPREFLPTPPELVWEYRFPNPNGSWNMPIFSLWVNEQGCWLGYREGWVVAVNHQGEPIQQYQLPKLCRNFVTGEEIPFASCDDGQIYDFSGKVAEPIYCLDSAKKAHFYNPILTFIGTIDLFVIADLYGNLCCLDRTFSVIWQQENNNTWLTYFLGVDRHCIYQGCYRGLICYEKNTGQIQWELFTQAPILCGLVLENTIFLGCSDRQIYKVSKLVENPQLETIFTCSGMPYNLITTPENNYLWVSDSNGKISCLDLTGKLLETISLQSGAAIAMQMWEGNLYVGTTVGLVACLAVNPQPNLSQESIKTPQFLALNDPIIKPTEDNEGVILECIKQGKKLKIRAISPLYNQDWNVAFPQHLRVEGARYQVEALKESKSGNFYRVIGKIKLL